MQQIGHLRIGLWVGVAHFPGAVQAVFAPSLEEAAFFQHRSLDKVWSAWRCSASPAAICQELSCPRSEGGSELPGAATGLRVAPTRSQQPQLQTWHHQYGRLALLWSEGHHYAITPPQGWLMTWFASGKFMLNCKQQAAGDAGSVCTIVISRKELVCN